MNRYNLRWHNNFITKMWIILPFFLKKFLSLCNIINRKKISYFWLFEFGLLILLFSPIIATIHIFLRIHHLIDSLLFLHILLIYINIIQFSSISELSIYYIKEWNFIFCLWDYNWFLSIKKINGINCYYTLILISYLWK